MLYLIHGTDTNASRAKLHTLLSSLFKRRPGAQYFHITTETIGTHNIDELVWSQGLFERKYIVVFDHILKDREWKDSLLRSLKAFGQTEHVCIFLEEKLDKKELAAFEKYAKEVREYISRDQKKERFNIFSLADALGRRDKRCLWTLYLKAKEENITDEEIHGTLFWQVKCSLLALSSANAEEAGLKPFVFNKSKSLQKYYSEGELRALASRLVGLLHDSRRGTHEFDIALERFMLSI